MISVGSDGYAALRYHAIQVVAVMRPEEGAPVRVDITQDGKPLAHADAGKDVHYDASGTSYVTVDAARAYDLAMNAHFGSHELRLMPQRYGLGFNNHVGTSASMRVANEGRGALFMPWKRPARPKSGR
jgi:hypothetical protein